MVLQYILHIQYDSFKVIEAFANACFLKLHMLPFWILQLYFQYITLTSRKNYCSQVYKILFNRFKYPRGVQAPFRGI